MPIYAIVTRRTGYHDQADISGFSARSKIFCHFLSLLFFFSFSFSLCYLATKRVAEVGDWKFKTAACWPSSGEADRAVKFDFIFIKNRLHWIPSLRFALDSVVPRSRYGNWMSFSCEKKGERERKREKRFSNSVVRTNVRP